MSSSSRLQASPRPSGVDAASSALFSEPHLTAGNAEPEAEPEEEEEPQGDLPFGFGGLARSHAPSLPFGFGASSQGLAALSEAQVRRERGAAAVGVRAAHALLRNGSLHEAPRVEAVGRPGSAIGV